MTDPRRALAVAEAISYVEARTPFHPGANIKGVGVSCGHFFPAVYRAAGIDVPDLELGKFAVDWHLHDEGEHFVRLLSQYAREFPGPPEPGDIVLFKFGKAPSYGHGAIVIEWPLLIHAHWRAGVIYVDASIDPQLRPAATKYYTPFYESNA